MAIRIKHGSEQEGNDWWRMWMWLEGSKEELDQIDHVVYALDPTFPNPVRTVKDRESKFRLDTSGAGEFRIHAKAVTKDGMNIPIKYDLKLSGGQEAWTQEIKYDDKGKTSIRQVEHDFHSVKTQTHELDLPGIDLEEIINLIKESSDEADSNLIGKLSSLTKNISHPKIENVFSDQTDADILCRLKEIVKSGDVHTRKAANLKENIDDFAGVIVKLLEKFI
jgi:transcription initiation factor IIF auxiliary subunit